MTIAEKPPRAAATVVVVRDGPVGIEVLLLRRAERGDHNSGAWVFPGGLVDAADRAALPFCRGVEPAAADARLGVAAHALDYWVAAVRESFEEAGLLFARDREGRPLVPDAARDSRLESWRAPLQRGEQALAALCHEEGLTLAVDELVYFSHWVTPPGRAQALRHALLHRPRAAGPDRRARRWRDSSSSSGSRPPRR